MPGRRQRPSSEGAYRPRGEEALRESLAAGARALQTDLAPRQVEQLLAYLRLLARWGQAYNLSGPAAIDDAVHRHLLDSLAVLPHIHGHRCLDVGTGAGLPGLVLAVADPGRHWVLLDSSGKKARFCRQAVIELGLAGVEVAQSRVEDYRPPLAFDTVTARAWSSVRDVIERVWPLLAPGGRVLIMKGVPPTPELAAASPLPGKATVVGLQVPGLAGARHLVVVERTAEGGPAAAVS